MFNIKIPLELSTHGFVRESDLKKSVDNSLRILLTTPLGGCPTMPDYGFLFNNLSFENFNENEGIVSGQSGALAKRISGTSKNSNTFAYELCQQIASFEKRILDPEVSMAYVRRDRIILVEVKGFLNDPEVPYQYNSVIKIWN